MKTYIADIIPKLQRFSQKLDNLTLLTNQHWVVLDELDSSKTVFIFRTNNELLISRNGKVEKARWEYLGNNSILIDQKDTSHLFKQGFFDENVLALKVDSKEEYAFLVNENRYNGEINSVEKATDFLNQRYLIETKQKTIELKSTGEHRKNSTQEVPVFEPPREWTESEKSTFVIVLVLIIFALLLLIFNMK